jgi:hypothetical protein
MRDRCIFKKKKKKMSVNYKHKLRGGIDGWGIWEIFAKKKKKKKKKTIYPAAFAVARRRSADAAVVLVGNA